MGERWEVIARTGLESLRLNFSFLTTSHDVVSEERHLEPTGQHEQVCPEEAWEEAGETCGLCTEVAKNPMRVKPKETVLGEIQLLGFNQAREQKCAHHPQVRLGFGRGWGSISFQVPIQKPPPGPRDIFWSPHRDGEVVTVMFPGCQVADTVRVTASCPGYVSVLIDPAQVEDR
jgi:hypothetical protein